MDVQYVCNISLPVLPDSLGSVRLNIGCPVVRTDGRCTVTCSPIFLRWVELLTHGAPQARFARLTSAIKVFILFRFTQFVTILQKDIFSFTDRDKATNRLKC